MHFCPGQCLLFQPLASPRQTLPSQEELGCIIRWFGAVDLCLQKMLCLPSLWPKAVLPLGFQRQKVERGSVWLTGKGNGEGPLTKYTLCQGSCLGLPRDVVLSTALGNSVAPACPGDKDSPCLLDVVICVFISVAVLFSTASKAIPKIKEDPCDLP